MRKTKYQKEREEHIKKAMYPADAKPLIELIQHMHEHGTEEQRKLVGEGLKRGFEKAGALFLQRAFDDEIISEEEFKERGFGTGDMAAVLQAYYNKLDGHFTAEENPIVVTMPGSPVDKNKDFIKERFNVDVINVQEANKMMKEKAHDKP